MFQLLLALFFISPLAYASEYRTGAAEQVYKVHSDKVYRGLLPPLLKAVGIVQITVNSSGDVTMITWLRRPDDLIAAQIEHLILTAGPLGATSEAGAVFVETWLWDKSGKFQLKSLSEGQQ